jgi:hypothetical protein
MLQTSRNVISQKITVDDTYEIGFQRFSFDIYTGFGEEGVGCYAK